MLPWSQIGGVALLAWSKRLAAHRVTLHDKGSSFVYAKLLNRPSVMDGMEKSTKIFTEEQMKILKVPVAVIKNILTGLLLHRKDGRALDFTVNSIDSIPHFFAECLEEARDKFASHGYAMNE